MRQSVCLTDNRWSRKHWQPQAVYVELAVSSRASTALDAINVRLCPLYYTELLSIELRGAWDRSPFYKYHHHQLQHSLGATGAAVRHTAACHPTNTLCLDPHRGY